MSEELFQVIFRGKILSGFSIEQVRASLAGMFKTDEARIAAQLAMPKWVIKAGINKAIAQQIQERLRAIGMMVAVIADDPAASATQPTASALNEARASDKDESQVARSAIDNKDESQVARSAIDNNEIDQPLENKPKAPAFAADLSAYSLAEVGAIMDETSATKPQQNYNLAQFSLAEIGAQIVEKASVAPLKVDISSLSLAPAEIVSEEPKSALWREMES
jgi:hypothetical protein